MLEDIHRALESELGLLSPARRHPESVPFVGVAEQSIDRIPDDLKAIYATAFEIDSAWLIEAASRRQKWIDQSQSLNLYIANPSGKKLDGLYRLAWARGLKTTYYLRSRSATHVEKSTLRGTDGKLNSVASVTMMSPAPIIVGPAATAPDLSGAVACSIDNPECEACQ